MREYFDIKSEKWKTTVKWCLKLEFVLGLILGAKYDGKLFNLFMIQQNAH